LKAFDNWLVSNGQLLRSRYGKAIIYAGIEPSEFRKAKQKLPVDSDLKKIWEKVEAINSEVEKLEGRSKYDLLTDVIKRCSKSPTLKHTHGPESGSDISGIKSLLHYTKVIENKQFSAIDKNKIKYVWGQLSATYVANSEGEVTILEGRTAQNKRVTLAFTMVQKELEALWKRKNLPEATQKNAAAMISGYLTHYDGQRQLSEEIVREARDVMRKARQKKKG
jgi:hypothetical protein